MNWSDVKEVIGRAAPVAGTMLGGSAGAAVGNLLAGALDVEPTPEAVAAAFRTDPNAAAKVQQVEADLEKTRLEVRGRAVQTEAAGESWLQRNWRPLIMLWFAALVGAHWLGWTPDNLDSGVVTQLLDVVQIGIGGYVIGRSAEKITRSVTGAGLLDNIVTRRKD